MTVAQYLALSQKPKKKKKRVSEGEWLARFLLTPDAPRRSPEEAAKQRQLFELHDQAIWTLRFPLAPTVDHYLINPQNRKNRIYTSEARGYRKAVACFWRRHWDCQPPPMLTGRLRVLVVMCFARKIKDKNDLSNRVKPFEDAFTEAGIWKNDSQIDDERILRGPLCPPIGCMDVTIEVIP